MKLYTCIPILPLTFATFALGFTIPAASSRSSRAGCRHLNSQVLNDMDLMCILNTASYCLEEHCPVDDTEALMNTLADQENRLCQRVANLDQALHLPSQTALAYVNANTNKLSLLNDMDLMCMINVANYCEDQQACSLDDREAVMYTLSQQREAATSRVAQLAHNMADIIKLENAPGRDVQSLLMALRNILSADQLAMV